MLQTLPASILLLTLGFAPGARQQPATAGTNAWTVQADARGNQATPTRLNLTLRIRATGPASETAPASDARTSSEGPTWGTSLSQSLPGSGEHLRLLIVRLTAPGPGRGVMQSIRLVPRTAQGDISLLMLLPKGWSVPPTGSVVVRSEGTSSDSAPSIHKIPHGSAANPSLLTVKLPAAHTAAARAHASYVVECTLVKTP